MDGFVKGDNVILAEYSELLDAWVMWGCARSCALNIQTEFIETSVSGSGKFRTYEPSAYSFSGSFEGLVVLEGDQMLSLPEVRLRQLEGRKLLMRYQRTSIAGATYTEEANFYIRTTADEGALNQMNSFNVELQGTGALTQVFTPAEILGNVKRFQYTGTGGETVMTSFKDVDGNTISLAGKNVLGFEKDGVGFSKHIKTGTPVDKEFKFTGTNQIEIAIPFAAGEEAFGYYRN